MKQETLAIHAGYETDPTTKSVAVPIYQTVAYEFDNAQHGADLFDLAVPGNIYSRIMNPTNDVLEKRMAAMEGGLAGLAVASGMAAINYAVLTIARSGDNIISTPQLYGGTYTLFAHMLPSQGIEVRFAEDDSAEAIAKLIDDNTKAVYCETIGNPAGNIVDLEAISKVAHDKGVAVIVDNTVATPALCKPIEHGADIVVHALTKYIGGHGTSIGGIVVDGGNFDWGSGKFPGFTEPDASYHGLVHWEAFKAFPPAGGANIAYIMKMRLQLLRDTGACISPFNAWMMLQGLETLHLRMARISTNAKMAAEFLASDDRVAWVNYPGLDDSPQNEVARKYCSGGFGGLLGFGLKSGFEGGRKFIESLSLFSHLANIGDAKSLAIHPASTTHSQLSETEQISSGVSPDYIRLSLGIEDWPDLEADLRQALDAAS